MNKRAVELNSGCTIIEQINISDYKQENSEIIGNAVGAMFGFFGGNILINAEFYIGINDNQEYLLVVRGTNINKFKISKRNDNVITLLNDHSYHYETSQHS